MGLCNSISALLASCKNVIWIFSCAVLAGWWGGELEKAFSAALCCRFDLRSYSSTSDRTKSVVPTIWQARLPECYKEVVKETHITGAFFIQRSTSLKTIMFIAKMCQHRDPRVIAPWHLDFSSLLESLAPWPWITMRVDKGSCCP